MVQFVTFAFFMGFPSDTSVGDDCFAALHSLRIEELMQIESVNTLDDDILVYTLVEGQEKTAVLGCQLVENENRGNRHRHRDSR